MRMFVLTFLLLTTSCGKSIMRDGREIECYGLVTEYLGTPKKVEGVQYEIVTGNVAWSLVTFGTIVFPVWLMGWELKCPVEGQ